MATNEQLKLTIDIATRDAVKALQALGKEAGDAGLSAGEIADAMDASTAKMITDLEHAESAVTALGNALGPELRAKIGDAKIDKFVGDLRNAGLEFDQITSNADRFASSLRKMDEASGSVKDTEQAVRRLGETSDQSRSVLANMVGNSAQDLGALVGVGGSAGVMLGQLAEYATDGNIALANLAKTAGPLAAVGLGVAAISSVMEENARQQKFLRDQTKAFTEALISAREENHSTTSSIAGDWEQAGTIEAQISNATATMVEFGQATDDMAKIHELKYPTAQKKVVDFAVEIDKLQMRAEDFAQLVQLPIEGIQRWGEEMVAAGKDAGQVNLVMQGAAALHERLSEAQATAALNARIFGASLEEAASSGNTYLATMAGIARVQADINSSQIDAIAKQEALRNSYQNVTESLGRTAHALGDTTKSAKEQRDSLNATRSDVIAYVREMGNIPAKKLTEILADLDRGNIEAALKVINELTKARVIPISVRLGVSGGNSPSGTLSPGQKNDLKTAADLTLTTFDDLLAGTASSSSGGSSGGGAAVAKRTADDIAREMDSIMSNRFEVGALSEAAYRKYLKGRLDDYKKYSDDWMSIWRELHALDEADAAAAKKKADAAKAEAEAKKKAAKEAADARKKAAEEAQRAEDEALQRAANRAIVAANIAGATYMTINTAADPNAVVNAIQQYQRSNGPVPIKVTG